MVQTPGFNKYALSTEELALAFALVNRPDLSKAILFETFGELPEQVIEERLKAASHSLLARQMVSITSSNVPRLSESLQDSLAPLLFFQGVIQLTLNTGQVQIINIHLGRKKRVTAHWVEQGVIHHLVSTSQWNLDMWVTERLSPPDSLPDQFIPLIEATPVKLPLQTFASLPEMNAAEGLTFLTQHGLPGELADALLRDLRQPSLRASVSYLPLSPESDVSKPEHFMQPVAGFFFLKGRAAWLLVFPNTEQEGRLLAGSQKNLRAMISELRERKENAFNRA